MMKTWVSVALHAIAAFVVTAFVYCRAVEHEFVCFDDKVYVLENEHMRGGLTAENILWAFSDCSWAGNWHPLTWLSLMADVSVTKTAGVEIGEWNRYDNPVSRTMHGHNVLLHALNAALLFLLALILLQRLYPAPQTQAASQLAFVLLLVLFWALHPLRVEAVCWITERKEVLCLFWSLLAFIGYFKSRHWLAVVCAGLAMLSKSVAVTIPVVIFAWDWIFERKIRWLRVMPYVTFALAACWLTMKAQAGAISLGNDMSPTCRLMCIFGGPAIYLKQTFWPVGLSLFYGNSQGLVWPVFLSGVLIVAFVFAICGTWLYRRMLKSAAGRTTGLLDILAFGVAWVYVGLLPMIGIVKAAGDEHCDRFTYWVGSGATVVFALLVGYVNSQRSKISGWLGKVLAPDIGEWDGLVKIARRVLICSLVVLGAISIHRIGLWKDSLTISRDTMAKSWDPFVAEPLADMLVSKFGERGRDEAEYWLRGCASHWKTPDSYFALGRLLLQRPPSRSIGGEVPYAEAEHLLQNVLDMDPDHQRAKELLAEIKKLRSSMK